MIANQILFRLAPSGTLLVALMMCCSLAAAQSVEEFDTTTPPVGAEPSPKEVASADLSKVAELIVERTNEFRQEHGLPPLSVDSNLTEAAQYFADYMARTNKYGHQADGNTPSQRASEHGYNYCIVLENIAYAYRTTGYSTKKLTTKFVKGWKNSEGHRENMLDPHVTETGVAVAKMEDQKQYFAVQMFGRPRSKAIEFKITNESGEQVEYTVSRKNGERTFRLPPRLARTHTQCRPSQLNFGWTQENDKVDLGDVQSIVVRKKPGQGLEANIDQESEQGASAR